MKLLMWIKMRLQLGFSCQSEAPVSLLCNIATQNSSFLVEFYLVLFFSIGHFSFVKIKLLYFQPSN